MAELFELEEEVIRMSSDVKDKYERDMANTATGAANLPVRVSILVYVDGVRSFMLISGV
jgi:hypothetical protein